MIRVIEHLIILLHDLEAARTEPAQEVGLACLLEMLVERSIIIEQLLVAVEAHQFEFSPEQLALVVAAVGKQLRAVAAKFVGGCAATLHAGKRGGRGVLEEGFLHRGLRSAAFLGRHDG